MKSTKPTHYYDTYDEILAERNFYKRIVDNLPAVVHINNVKEKYVEWVNKSGEKFSGHPAKYMEKNVAFLNEVIMPDDISWLQQSIIEFGNLRGDDIYTSIYKMRHANGSVATYHGFAKVLEYDEKNNPLLTLAVDVDITNEIRNYEQLKRQVDELTKKLNAEKLKVLTKTEIRVTQLLCECKTLKQIAEILTRSIHTIDNHKRNIFTKLEISKIQQLMVWGKEVGLI